MTDGEKDPNDSDTKALFLSKTAAILEAIKSAKLTSDELARLESEIAKIKGERNTGKHQRVAK